MFIKTPHDTLKAMWDKIPTNIRVAFFSAFFVGFVVHLFVFTNTLPVHDQVKSLAGYLDWASYQGRWLTEPVVLVTGLFSLPWLHGFLSIFLLSISSCLVVSVIRVRGYVSCVLISAVIVTFPAVAGFFAYMHIAVAVFLSLMFACLAAFLAGRYKFGFVFAVIPIVLSLAIYQSFFSVSAALLVIVLIMEVLRAHTAWLKIVFMGIKFIGALGGGMVLYLASVRFFYPDGLLVEYQAFERIGQMPLYDLPNRLFTAYVEVARFFLIDGRNFHFSFMNIVFVLAFVACGVLLVLWCVRKGLYREPVKLVLLGVLLFLLPLACNVIYLMGPAEVHDLMVYGIAFIFIFVLVIADLYFSDISSGDDGLAGSKIKKALFVKSANVCVWVVALAMSLTVYNYWILSNQAYFKLNIAYQTTYAQSVLLLSQIQSLDGYSYDMEIKLVGAPKVPQGMPELGQVTLTGSIGPELFGSWSYPVFLQYFLNFTQRVTYLNHGIIMLDCDELADAVRALPVYPNSGSIAIINDTIYVRFPFIDLCCWEFWPREFPACCGNGGE